MIEDAFGDIDPLRAQYEMPVERYVEICAPLKPAFIHHDTTKRLIHDLLEDFGCDLEPTYFDVPRLRMVTSDGYLTSGVGFAHHPHRDTWYSAPMSQLNWWLPIYDIESESVDGVPPRLLRPPVKNGSSEFNYYEWNATGRKDAAKHVKSDTRKQPKPEEPIELDPQIRLSRLPAALSCSPRRTCTPPCRTPRASPATASTSGLCTSTRSSREEALRTSTPSRRGRRYETSSVSAISKTCPRS